MADARDVPWRHKDVCPICCSSRLVTWHRQKHHCFQSENHPIGKEHSIKGERVPIPHILLTYPSHWFRPTPLNSHPFCQKEQRICISSIPGGGKQINVSRAKKSISAVNRVRFFRISFSPVSVPEFIPHVSVLFADTTGEWMFCVTVVQLEFPFLLSFLLKIIYSNSVHRDDLRDAQKKTGESFVVLNAHS